MGSDLPITDLNIMDYQSNRVCEYTAILIKLTSK